MTKTTQMIVDPNIFAARQRTRQPDTQTTFFTVRDKAEKHQQLGLLKDLSLCNPSACTTKDTQLCMMSTDHNQQDDHSEVKSKNMMKINPLDTLTLPTALLGVVTIIILPVVTI
jgi:hypothetical protein